MPTIRVKSSKEDVQAELAAATKQAKWNEQQHWDHFIKRRTEICEKIIKETGDQNWREPSVEDDVIAKFVIKANEKWQDSWVLKGGWLDDRQDIVAWLVASYWYNRQKVAQKKAQKNLASSIQHEPAIDATNEAQPEDSGSAGTRKAWKEVVMMQEDEAET